MIIKKTKGQESCEINYQITEFLYRGGKINQVDTGITGINPLKGHKGTFMPSEKQNRHLLTAEILAVSARRSKAKVAKVKVARLKQHPTKLH